MAIALSLEGCFVGVSEGPGGDGGSNPDGGTAPLDTCAIGSDPSSGRLPLHAACASDADCCNNEGSQGTPSQTLCYRGACCIAAYMECRSSGDCCSGSCTGGYCDQCGPTVGVKANGTDICGA